MIDHHAADRGLKARTPQETRDRINSDHPCCIGVGDACALLATIDRFALALLDANRLNYPWKDGSRASKALDEAELWLKE